MTCLNRISWPLFHAQKQQVLEILGRPTTTREDSEALSGILHLMDAIQDEAEPTDIDEENPDDD